MLGCCGARAAVAPTDRPDQRARDKQVKGPHETRFSQPFRLRVTASGDPVNVRTK